MVSILDILKMPNKRAQFKLKSLMTSFIEIQFYSYSAESGLMKELLQPTKKSDLIKSMRIKNVELFEHVLNLGLSLEAISCKNGKYNLKASLAKAMANSSGDPLSSMMKEMVHYHGDVFRNLSQNLNHLLQKDYLGEFGEVVAESSRIIEPFIKNFIFTLLVPTETYHILEIGCGSGEYFKYYFERNAKNTGIGIDYNANVVKKAKMNLSNEIYSSNFQIQCVDIRNPNKVLGGTFSIITSFQNIYYFNTTERQSLFVDLFSNLKKGGRFALLSVFPGKKPLSPYFDIILSSTKGCHPVPDKGTIIEERTLAGFKEIKKTRLIPGEELWGIVALK